MRERRRILQYPITWIVPRLEFRAMAQVEIFGSWKCPEPDIKWSSMILMEQLRIVDLRPCRSSELMQQWIISSDQSIYSILFSSSTKSPPVHIVSATGQKDLHKVRRECHHKCQSLPRSWTNDLSTDNRRLRERRSSQRDGRQIACLSSIRQYSAPATRNRW